MRVLLVSHDFVPHHTMGTEVYTWQLGKALSARGHDVHVFTTEKDVGRPNLRVDLRVHDGLPVHELVNNLFYNDFRETWDYAPAARSFGLFLDDLKPDVVHFMHLMYLSVACVEEAARRGFPVVFTLHDYWLQCPRFGQRVHADGSICHVIDFDRCGGCMARFKYRQTRVERATAKFLARVHERTGIDLAPAARRAADLVKGRRPAKPVPNGASGEMGERVRRMRDEVATRDRELRERLLPLVHRFVAPSRFLRRSFLEWGIPPERIVYSRAGIDLRPFEGFRREPSEKVRVAFIGTLARHKGPHLVLEAWTRLPAELRERAELVVHGPRTHNPDYVHHLDGLAERCGARIPGALDRHQVVEALTRVDVLVVPSVWYENSPLIILEALATRTPLVVSDLGGMAELVEPGESGFHFRVGDAADLARVLEGILRDPRQLEALYPDERPVKDVHRDAEELEALYGEAVAAAGEGA